MEVKSRPLPSQPPPEIAKIDWRTPSTPLRHQRPSTAGGGGQLLELTPIWQKVVNGRWPADVDRADVFAELAIRLTEPEWEVRQHGLRVLADIIPALTDGYGANDLDALMAPAVLGAVTHNLAHPAPAVRASALAVLLAYLKFTSDPEFVLRSIVTTGLESPAASGNLAGAVVQILPKLIDQTLSISHQSLVHLVTAVSKKLTHMQYQRQAMETLHKIKEHVGDSRFDHFLESYYPQVKRDLDVLCQVYRVEPNLRDSGIDLQTGQDTWSESSMSPTQPKFDDVVKIEEYDGAESDQETDDDCKVVHDNDDVNHMMANNSALLAARSEADRLLRVADDDDEDEIDSSRKSPRRVRFGGEVVKLRTPDSDVTVDGQTPGVSVSAATSEDGKSEDGDPSFEVIAGDANSATSSPRQQTPQQQTPRRTQRSSHIPVPINPVLSRPRCRNGEVPQSPHAAYENGDSSVTSSSEGETFRSRDFLTFQGFLPGAMPDGEMADLSFLPSDLIHLLAKQDDWRTRVRGLDRLASWVSSGRLTSDQGSHLLWYLISCLSEEPRQGRLIASVLRATRAVIAGSPGNLGSVLAWLVPGICRHLACGSPLPARLEAVDAIKTLMRISTPAAVINVIFSDRCVHSRSSKLRENSLLCLLYALMTFPSNEFDCVSLTSRIKDLAVSEPKRRVRQAVLETLAVLSQFVPRTALTVEPGNYDNAEDALFFSDGLQARLARRQLPAISHEGLILYALQIPPMTGTDVDWILAGVGSLSSGSARSRSQLDNSPKTHLSQSSDNMFHSSWSKEPSNQKMMAIGVAVPQRSYDNLYSCNNNVDERIYYSPTWSTDPRHNHPSNTQGFPHLNTSYGGRYSTRNTSNANNNNINGMRNVELSQTWNGSRWTTQTEIPPHVSIKPSVLSQSQHYHSGLPPIGGAHVADWRNRKDNYTEQLQTTGYRVYNQDDYRKGRWDRRQDNVSFRRPAMSTYNGIKENGLARSPIVNSEASRSEPSLVGRSPHSSPARTRSSHSPSLSSLKSIENGLTASSPSLAARANADDADGFGENLENASRLGTPGPASVTSSLISIVSQPHLDNGSNEREDGRFSRSSGRRDGDEEGGSGGAVTRHGIASPPPNPQENNVSSGTPHHPNTPNEQSVGTPSSDMSESSRNTEMTTKSMESLKFGNDESKPRGRIPRRTDVGTRSLRTRGVGFDIKASETSSLYPPSLQPFDNSRDAITKAVLQLENPEWEVIIQGLQTVVRLVRHHTKDIQGGVTHSFVVPLTKHIKNLRSQVSRGACQCARELFMTLGKHMDSEVEELAGSLLSRMADTNKFLRGDSYGALEAMVDHVSPSKSVTSLVSKGAKHQNAVVRGATCRLLLRLCNRLGPDKTLALPKDTRDAILLTGAKFLTEGSLETRKYAKEMFSTLSASHRLNGILVDVIPHNIMRNIQKVLTRITA